MAKPLDHTATTSPLARLLDVSAAARATAANLRTEAPALVPAVHSTATRSVHPLIKRECVLNRSADESLTRLTDLIRRSTGARVNASHAIRSLLLVLHTAWPRLEDELRGLGPLQLPSNAKGNEPSREALERTLAGAIARAMRSSEGVP